MRLRMPFGGGESQGLHFHGVSPEVNGEGTASRTGSSSSLGGTGALRGLDFPAMSPVGARQTFRALSRKGGSHHDILETTRFPRGVGTAPAARRRDHLLY